jgi:ABC-2 type transport system ATP-binding protein
LSNPILTTQKLSVYYGRRRGIIDVDLSVQPGEVFGFLGPNGAGKTTTLRVLLDLIRPTRGSATIFDLDCQKDGDQIRRRTGYLPGELSLYDSMTAAEFLNLSSRLRGNQADPAYRRALCERLDLDPSRRMREYSRGNKQKVGVVSAFMHRPDLLILDEPTTGLDPLIQQTVLSLVREAKAEGRTVFFSSHVLPEVQAVCDRVGIIREGYMIATERVDDIVRQNFRRLHLRLGTALPAAALELPGVTLLSQDDGLYMLEVRDSLAELMRHAAACQVLDLETLPVTLEEVFLTYYGASQGGNHV